MEDSDQFNEGALEEDSELTNIDHSDDHSQPRRSLRGVVPRRRFEIEGESYMINTATHTTPIPFKNSMENTVSIDTSAFIDDEPKTFKEVMKGANSAEWMGDMKDELESMEKNKVWNLVNLPPNRKTIG